MPDHNSYAAGLVVIAERAINKDGAAIWALLADISGWGRWSPAIDHAAVYGPLKTGTKFRVTSGKWEFDCKIIDVEPGHRFILRGKSLGVTLCLSWEIRDSHDGAAVRTEVSASGLIIRLFRKKAELTLIESLNAWLAALKARLEKAGEKAPVINELDRPSRPGRQKTGFAFPFSIVFGPIGRRPRDRTRS
jgi:hypothetical protein